MAERPLILLLIACDDPVLCGGEAVHLGHMLRAGLPVPDGFVVSTNAFHTSRQHDGPLPELLAQQIVRAYDGLGASIVALPSATTAS